MKLFGASVWKTAQAASPAIETVMGGLEKLRGITASPASTGEGLREKPEFANGAVRYPLSANFVRTFATSGLPFMAFYEFTDLVGWHRDTYFAPDCVPGYQQDIGKSYTVWTHEATSAYRRHVFLDDMSDTMSVSFEIPSLDSASWFPLRIRIFDADGLYFQHDQKLVVERLGEGGAVLTSWKKIPQLRDALPGLLRPGRAAA